MIRADALTNPRLAGQVERYHTWPVFRRQSVGEHIWQQMRIWWQLFGSLPPEVSTYILWSDAGELVTGDLPFPIKAHDPALKAIMDEKEREALVDMIGSFAPSPTLSTVLRNKAKVCDLLEMWEFGLIEVAMGNRFGQPIVDDTRRAALKIAGGCLSEAEQARMTSYMTTMEQLIAGTAHL